MLVKRPARRPLFVLLVAGVTVGAWFGLSPPRAPGAEVASVPPSAAEPASTGHSSGAVAFASAPRPADPTPSGSGPRATPGASASHGATATSYRLRHATPTATALLRAELDASLERLRAKYGMPGISAAIMFADGSIWQGAAGLADVAARRPVTPDTAFAAASVSKTFTAALILGLIEDGRLGLDSNVKAYLPKVALDPAITVRQLLDHTSGLRDFYFHPGIDKALLSKPGLAWDAARSLRYVGKPYAKPGRSWHYSNTNYLVLGMLAEAVGGAPVAGQLRDRFLTPLGLRHTYYQGAEAPAGPIARGYQFTGKDPSLRPIDLSDGSKHVPFTSVVTASGAAGSIATTSGDLVRWARALYGGSALDEATRALMVADIAGTAQYKPSVGYGLGVQAVPVAGQLSLGHSGRFLGARAILRWLPEERLAIAVLTNQSRRDPNVVLAELLRLALMSRSECFQCAPER